MGTEKGGTMTTGNGSTPKRGQGRICAVMHWLCAAISAVRARGIWLFVFLGRHRGLLSFLCVVGVLLWLAWVIPWSVAWRSTVLRFVHENPVFVVVLIISLVVPLFWLLLWKLPQWQVAAVPEMKDRIDLESKSRQTLVQIVGGAAALGAFYFTAQTLETSQKTLETTQQGQITDRFTKAIDQLGDTKLEIKLGGIYALERIAKDSERDHWVVMEVLTAFVRQHSPRKVELSGMSMLTFASEKIENEKAQDPPADIQAILTVIGRRGRTFEHGEVEPLNLSMTHLWGANLQKANLQKADLGGAQLSGANLEGAQLQKANLTMTELQDAYLGEAQLQGASLVQAQLQKANFQDAQLQGTILRYAQLQEAHLNKAQLQGANLQGAQLQRADLQGANLSQVEYLTQDQINMACTNKYTILPKGLTRPDPCPATPYTP